MIKRGIDLGGSTVRLGVRPDYVIEWPAKVLEIPVDAPVKDYASDDVLADFVIRKHPMKQLENRRFVRDDLINHYQGHILFCDNQEPKVYQEITYINAAYALAAEACLNFYQDQDTSLVACIPTSEYFTEGDFVNTFKSNLTGEFEVYFPKTHSEVRFTINPGDVRVTAEGVVAVYKYGKKQEFRESVTLIVDVGHRSTDITILKNFKPVGNTAVSRPKGGMNIAAFVKSSLERDGILLNTEEVEHMLCTRYIVVDNNLIDVTDKVIKVGKDKDAVKSALFDVVSLVTTEIVDQAMNRYYVKRGTDIKDMTEYVTKAKQMFCASVKADVIDVLASDMMNLTAINNVVPIGRAFSGDIESENNMVYILMKELGIEATVYADDNMSTANIVEIAKLLD